VEILRLGRLYVGDEEVDVGGPEGHRPRYLLVEASGWIDDFVAFSNGAVVCYIP
jgi:hypothetical protein